MEEIIMNKIKQKISDYLDNRKTRRMQRLYAEVNHRVQIREFNGICCLAVDNEPVVPMQGYDHEMLNKSRALLLQYLNRPS